jgi:uncharacterized protein
VPVVTALARYPVKSCRGEQLAEAVVQPWGLAGDRRWMVVDADGCAVTAREVHQLLLVRPELVPDGVHLDAPGQPGLTVATPDGGASMVVDVWGSRVHAARAGAAADEWISAVVGLRAHLVYLHDPTRRPTNPRYTRPEDRVSFADGYPLLLTNQASLAALNADIAAGSRAAEGPLPMTRFRPSVVVDDAPAWAEDDWRQLRIGALTFRAVKGCDRCVMTMLDPDTAVKGMEPIATLARRRRWDGKTWFGVNLVPDTPAAGAAPAVRVGDEIEVISAVAPGDGPQR